MSFANTELKKSGGVKFEKIEYLKTNPGSHIIRILEPQATRLFTHYVNGYSIKCLGDECPICANNKKIYMENPDNFRDIKGWNASSRRFFVNILDKTPSKVCPSCGEVVKKGPNGSFPPSCPSCNTFVTNEEVRPANVVRLYGFGVQVAEQFNAFEHANLTPDGEPIPLTEYDIMLMVTGQRRDKKTNAVPMPHQNEPVEGEYDLFDTSKAVIELTAEEMTDLQRGTQLRDIFAARRADESSDVEEDISDELEEDVNDRIKELFAN